VTFALIVGAGSLGAVCRYLVSGVLQRSARSDFPVGTLVVNLTGAFTIGIVAGSPLFDPVAATAVISFLGGYTTFSTFTFETVRLAEAGALDQALRNVAATAVVGLAAAGAGLAIAAAL